MFRSAYSALNWAYQEITRPIVRISSINDMRGNSLGEDNALLVNLSVVERHQQAAAIIGLVAGLGNPVSSEYLGVKFSGTGSLDCVRSRLFVALGTGVHQRRPVDLCMLKYLGADIGQRQIRQEMHCGSAAAITRRISIFSAMDGIHRRAMAEITEQLESRGLVGWRQYA